MGVPSSFPGSAKGDSIIITPPENPRIILPVPPIHIYILRGRAIRIIPLFKRIVGKAMDQKYFSVEIPLQQSPQPYTHSSNQHIPRTRHIYSTSTCLLRAGSLRISTPRRCRSRRSLPTRRSPSCDRTPCCSRRLTEQHTRTRR